ncbi:MAG: DUF11 domain-containing protein, partial [Acidimicrobiia bacterium]|nr:DUF11 domain-containing protein [Acidimicrobiia bacterium]
SLPEPGGLFTYTVVVSNPVSNVDSIVVDSVDDVRTAPGGAVETFDVSGSCDVAGFPVTLGPGESFECSFVVEHLGDGGDTFTDVVVASGTDDDGGDASGVSNEVSVSLTDVPSLPLDVFKLAEPDDLFEPGGGFAYGASVANPASNVDAITVSGVFDTRVDSDGTVAVVDISSSCNLSAFSPPAFPVTLQPGASFLCFFDDDHFGVPGDTFSDTVTAPGVDDDGDDATGVSNEVTVSIKDALPTLQVAKVADPDEIMDIGVVTFTITVTNTSVEPVTVTSITDSVFTDIGSRCAALIGQVLQPGQSVACVFNEQFEALGEDPFTHTNLVTVTAIDDEANVAVGSDSASVVVSPVIGSILEGMIFLDVDADGVFDPEDVPISGAPATVTHAGSDGDLGTADDDTTGVSTSTDGGFTVDPATPGVYEVVTSPDTVVATIEPELNSGFGASGATLAPTTAGVYLVTLQPDGSISGLDFGFGLIDLALAGTLDTATPTVGSTVVQTFTVTNEGAVAASSATVQVILPAGLTFQLAAADGAYDPASGVWTLPDLAPGAIAQVSLTLIVDAGTAGSQLTTTAEIATAQQFDVDSTPGNAVAGEDDIVTVDVVPTEVLDTTLATTTTAATTTTETLPKTGGDLGALAGGALVLLMAGALLLLAARDRGRRDVADKGRAGS